MVKSAIVVGGGINGMCIARALAQASWRVTLIDKSSLGQATSANSSRLLHGGLRYLEYGQIRFVWEALEQRANWLKQYPEHVKVIEKFVPCYKGSGRATWQVWLGVKLYNLLAGRSSLGPSRWWSSSQVALQMPSLKTDQCVGAVSYFDLMMDDQALMSAIRNELVELGVEIREQSSVDVIKSSGRVVLVGGEQLDASLVVNASGPWVSQLLARSNIRSDYQLEYNRGVHLVVDRPCERAAVLQQPDGRIVFALPLKDQTLFGTTEQALIGVEDQRSEKAEIEYLTEAFNRVFSEALKPSEIVNTTSGIRPIVKAASSGQLSAASREAVLEHRDHLINVFGGKWTSAPALAEDVALLAERVCQREHGTLVPHSS